jgi:glutathione S-transferase
VPVFVDGERVLFESGAILLYLADAHADRGLIPAPRTRLRTGWFMNFGPRSAMVAGRGQPGV